MSDIQLAVTVVAALAGAMIFQAIRWAWAYTHPRVPQPVPTLGEGHYLTIVKGETATSIKLDTSVLRIEREPVLDNWGEAGMKHYKPGHRSGIALGIIGDPSTASVANWLREALVGYHIKVEVDWQ